MLNMFHLPTFLVMRSLPRPTIRMLIADDTIFLDSIKVLKLHRIPDLETDLEYHSLGQT